MAIFDEVRDVVVEQLSVAADAVKMESKIIEDLGADSLDLFQIINDIEDEFEVSIEDPESIVTVKDAVDFVESHQ